MVVPQLHTKPKPPELFFEQDEVLPHYSLRVRDDLNRVFLQHWFGRRGIIEWPPRLPDLSPMDFFFGGVVKNEVYEKNSKTIKELKDCIHDAFKYIDEDLNLCHTGCHSALNRSEKVAMLVENILSTSEIKQFLCKI